MLIVVLIGSNPLRVRAQLTLLFLLTCFYISKNNKITIGQTDNAGGLFIFSNKTVDKEDTEKDSEKEVLENKKLELDDTDIVWDDI